MDGYDGTLCGNNIDDCSPNPCLNGASCTDEVAGYECTCTDGFEGDTCGIGLFSHHCHNSHFILVQTRGLRLFFRSLCALTKSFMSFFNFSFAMSSMCLRFKGLCLVSKVRLSCGDQLLARISIAVPSYLIYIALSLRPTE